MFKDAKIGDFVAIEFRNGYASKRAIAKVTATQVIVDDKRYRRDFGREVGRGDGGRVAPWTPEHDARNARYKAAVRLSTATEELRRVATGWGVPMPRDVDAANALSSAIEAYIDSTKVTP